MTKMGKLGVGAGITIVAAAIVRLAVTRATSGVPLPRIDINTNCVQVMSVQPTLTVYTGDWVATPWQWGFSAANVTTAAQQHTNGVGFNEPKTCPMSIYIDCSVRDCHQSVARIAASPGTPKWLIATGAPNMCCYDGLQVWKFDSATGRFKWYAFIQNQTDRVDTPFLDGDVAYASQNRFSIPELYTKFDLNAKTVVARDQALPASLPAPQLGIQGYTYRVNAIIPSPLPPNWTGPNLFFWQREGGPTATETPTSAPIPTLTATQAPADCTPREITKLVTVVVTATRTPTPTSAPCPDCTKTRTPHWGPGVNAAGLISVDFTAERWTP